MLKKDTAPKSYALQRQFQNSFNLVPNMKINNNTLNRIIVFTPLALSLLFELKSFEIWGQIIYLWDHQASPIGELLILSPHSFRYAAMYPVLIVSEQFGIDKNLCFSWIVLVMGFLSAVHIFDSLKRLQRKNRRGNTASLFVSIIIVFLLFSMNGRGAVALFGFSLLVNIIVQSETGTKLSIGMSINLFLSLICSSVSSGTLAISCATLLLYVLKNLRHIFLGILRLHLTKESLKICAVGMSCFIAFSGIVIVGFLKNLDFYGVGYGGFVNMLSHGMGVVFKPLFDVYSLPLLFTMVIGLAVVINLIVKNSPYPSISQLLVICIAFGLFGYTTLSMAIVPLLILVGSALPDFRVSKGGYKELQYRNAVLNRIS